MARTFGALACALIVFGAALRPGQTWPGILALATAIACGLRLRAHPRAARRSLDVALTLTFAASVFAFANNEAFHKYGGTAVYLIGAAVFARFATRSSGRNIGFLVAVSGIGVAWAASSTVQAVYETQRAGALTTDLNGWPAHRIANGNMLPLGLSMVTALYFGITRWSDWQIQTPCL